MDRKYTVINKDNADLTAAAAALPRLSDEELIAASNKGIFKRAGKDIDAMGSVPLTVSGEPVKAVIAFSDGEVTAGDTLNSFVCTCPSKTICRHIIGAALVIREFIDDNAAAPGNEPVPETTQAIPEETPSAAAPEAVSDERLDNAISGYFTSVEETVSSIFKKGIMNCGQAEQDSLTSLSLKADSSCRRIAALCRAAASDIEAMNSRSPAFNPLTASLRLGRIMNTVHAAAGECGKILLQTGDHTDRGNGEFICLGVYPYRTASGFAGVTAVLYETEKKEFFTYGSGLSDIYEKTADAASEESYKKQLRRHCHWQNEVSLEAVSGTGFRLMNYKADSRNRISSSKQTVCISGYNITPRELPREITTLPKPPEYDYFSIGSSETFCAFPLARVEDISFDTVQQVLHFTLISPENGAVQCELVHSQVNERAERFIESLTDRDMQGYCMILRVTRRGIIPVSLLGEKGSNNFFFNLK